MERHDLKVVGHLLSFRRSVNLYKVGKGSTSEWRAED